MIERRGFIIAFLLGVVSGVILLLFLGVKLTLPDGEVVTKKEVREKIKSFGADKTKLFRKLKEDK